VPDESPKIEHISWGRITVQGLGEFKDVKLWPGGGRAWDWDETGTRHEPGIQPSDVEELIAHGSEIVVLSRGMELRLKTCPETFDRLRNLGIEVHITESEAAAASYNKLAENRKVGALIHSTC
jgi:hypothetical protein